MFLKQLLTEFERSQTAYCVVGGVAVNLYGIPRMTYDLDVVVALDKTNLEKVETVFEQLGLRCQQPVSLIDCADSAVRYRLLAEKNLVAVTYTDSDNPLDEVDVLVNPPIAAEELITRAKAVVLDDITVKVIALEDLLALKRESGREQDKADIELLEELESE